jgi:hypothetical protein
MRAFWGIASCSLVLIDRSFRGLSPPSSGTHCPMMDAVRTSETSVYFYEATWRCIPENCLFNNFKFDETHTTRIVYQPAVITNIEIILRTGVLNLYSSTRTIVVLIFASEHKRKISIRTSTVYKYVKEHSLLSKQHRGVCEHQVENPCLRIITTNHWTTNVEAETPLLLNIPQTVQ